MAHLEDALEELERRGLRRFAAEPHEPGEVSFCSNDYLGLAGRRLAAEVVTGAGASRLISGERSEHGELERGFASWLGVEACLAFTSGYAANLGTVAALAGPEDLIVSDALNHASIIDGARLSRARTVVTPHNDVGAVARALEQRAGRRAWVAVESYYSMDADGPDLAELRKVCDAFGAALFVDEAHALGVLGPDGRGLAAEAGVVPDVLVGTLGKTFGSQGAIVGGRSVLREWLWNRARSFVFSTGLTPLAAAAAKQGLDEVQASPALRLNVARLASRLRDGLRALDLQVLGFGHIVPVLIGTAERAVQLSRSLREHGLVVPPIRPPTVPEGSSRLRLTVTARHRDADIDLALTAFRRALRSSP